MLKYTSFLLLGILSFAFSAADQWRMPPNCNSELINAPDFIFHNGVIITMQDGNPEAQALAIKEDKILAVGSNAEILALVESSGKTQIIDLNGLTILPGFNDAHCHWFSWREHLCTAYGEDISTYPSLEETMEKLSKNGWTSITELAFGRPDETSIEHLNNALALEQDGKLSVRVNGFWGGINEVWMFDAFGKHPPDRHYSDRIRAQGVKFYVDDPFGTADILSQEEINALVKRAHDDGWQIATHAVNLSGVEKILTAYENVLGNESNDQFRHRIEHAVKVNDDQLNRMLRKGIIASFQLIGPPDWPSQETHINYISNTQPELQMRWREFVEAGLPSVGSTDAPFNNTTCTYNPFQVIYQGVTRQGYLDRAHAQWELDQRLTIAQCLKLMTIDGAYATKEEHIKGSLEPGKYADLIVVSNNPLDYENEPEQLLKIEVLQTMVGGKIEFCSHNNCFSTCADREDINLDSAILIVSQYLPDQQPELTFDQNLQTFWSSGDFPPQWIQIDLLQDQIIDRIDLIVSQYPEGRTVHQILASKENQSCDMNIIHEFDEFTKDAQVLTYHSSGSDTVRYLRILTTVSPSWVSWYEVNIGYEDGSTSSINNFETNLNLRVDPNPATSTLNLGYDLLKATNLKIILLTSEGKLVHTIFTGYRFSGHYEQVYAPITPLTPGIYFVQFITDGGHTSRKLIFQ